MLRQLCYFIQNPGQTTQQGGRCPFLHFMEEETEAETKWLSQSHTGNGDRK